MLTFRLQELIDHWQTKSKRPLELAFLSRETGISESVLNKMLNSKKKVVVTNTRFVEALCRFFKCDVGDFVKLGKRNAKGRSCHVDALYPRKASKAPAALRS